MKKVCSSFVKRKQADNQISLFFFHPVFQVKYLPYGKCEIMAYAIVKYCFAM